VIDPEYEILEQPADAEKTRRLRMVLLDELLGVLEELNLREIQFTPQSIVDKLRMAGVPSPSKISPTKALERIFLTQEKFMSTKVIPLNHATRRKNRWRGAI
jgi:hypothetical protein